MITNIEVSKGQFTRVKPRYVDVGKTVEWNSKNQEDYHVDEDEESELCRMDSGRQNMTNGAILRDHVHKIKQTFEKFQTKHALALAKQKTTSSERTETICKNCISKAQDKAESDSKYQDLQEEI